MAELLIHLGNHVCKFKAKTESERIKIKTDRSLGYSLHCTVHTSSKQVFP